MLAERSASHVAHRRSCCRSAVVAARRKPPQITLQKKDKGGINISKMCTLTKLDDEAIKAIWCACSRS